MQGDRDRPGARLLHMIGNAHIDPVWLWRWPEGWQEVGATFRAVVERMREYPELRFTCDSVAQLAWVEEADPELFEEIRARVEEGRWEVAGGWWVEPDCNLPCGESFVRQGLHGQRWLQRHLGRMATVGANVDPFGHNASLPQILRGSGLDTYLFLRPGPHELDLPGQAFWWRSPDGSAVLAYRIPHEYQTAGTGLDEHLRAVVASLPDGWDELACLYGVGNHGGGPTRANLDSIRRLSRAGEPARLECSTARRFFDRLLERGDELPVVSGELQHHAVGCYSAHAGIKRWNRRAERRLLAAETWDTVASVVAGTPPAGAALAHAWRQVLFNQFHDVLAGTAVEEAYEDARDQLGEAVAIAGRVEHRALRAITRRVGIEPEPACWPLVACNPNAWPVRAEVEVELQAGPDGPPASLADEHGRDVPLQPVRPSATVPGWRHRVVFPAELPPLGYRTYRLVAAGAAGRAGAAGAGAAGALADPPWGGGRPAVRARREAGAVVLESARLRATVDPETGWLASLVDLERDAELLASSAGAHAAVLADATDTWSHGTSAYRDEVGAFACESVRLLEDGPVRSVVRVVSRYRRSTLTEDLVLGGEGYLEVRATLDWRERLALLKLRVASALRDVSATFEIPYGHVERRPDGGEEPVGAWVDLGGTLPDGRRAGLAVLNDGKHAVDVLDGRVGLTVARSPVYAWHEPRRLDPIEDYAYLDQGVQRFTYRLLPHAGDWRAAGVARAAAELNQPPVVLLESGHSGPLEQRASFAWAEPPSVMLTVLKHAEDEGGDLVVRAQETAGRPVPRATIGLELLGRRIETAFGAHQIKTFRIPADPGRPAVGTDLLERPLHPDSPP
ncbi:MAG TPA: glycoside hydrolase family 38 C-terminal domain-containing protein [Actinomycetota bacterium]